MPDLGSGLVYYVVFLFSTVLHEAAHAWAAKRGGDLTAYHGGQVSLDPMPHIRREPFGMVILPILSVVMSGWPFGFASAPYDPQWALRYPRRAAWMALAGPGANLLLVILCIVLVRVGTASGVFSPPESVSFGHVVGTAGTGAMPGIGFVVSVFFSMNLVLAALNVIPVPPLDGSAALGLFLSANAANRYQMFLWSQPMIGLAGMLVAWRVFDLVFQPLFLLAVNLLYPGVTYG
jgi:Zn-dependent protease